jgi:hypothetical protein
MKTIKTAGALYLLVLCSTSLFSQALDQRDKDRELYNEILKMDSLLFNEAFNKCNLDIFKTIMSREFEFYDDRSGLNTSFEKAVASYKDRCSKPYTLTRELVNTSVHILGDYGALQKGVHDFFVDGNKVETAKFITVWEKTDDSWIVKRAISYDHEPASD